MTNDLGKIISLPDGDAIIIDIFSCYDGDFYEVEFIKGKNLGNKRRINIWSDEGYEYILKGLKND